MKIPAGTTSKSLEVLIADGGGLAVTGLVAATFPPVYYARTREPRVAVTLVDLASIGAAFLAGGVYEVGGGRYRLDVPDAAWATASDVNLIGETSNKILLHDEIHVTAATTGATGSGDVTVSGAYLDVDDADAIAAVLPGLAAYKAASDDAKAAALLEASERIDLAYAYQGSKYDLTPGAQPREFPRVPYRTGWTLNGLAYPDGATVFASGLQFPWGWTEIWDVDGDGNVVVPARVLQAVVYEADAILAGDAWGDAKDAQHAGLSSQQIGTAAEAYRGDRGPDGAPLLCRMADVRVRKYILRQGELL